MNIENLEVGWTYMVIAANVNSIPGMKSWLHNFIGGNKMERYGDKNGCKWV